MWRRASLAALVLIGCGSPAPGGDDAVPGEGADAAPGDRLDGGVAPPDECDADPPIFPGADEVPNGWDDDCDGLVDEVAVCASGAPYATIAEGVAAAPAGGGVEICAGTYVERLVIDRPVTLRGIDGAAATILDAGGAGRAIAIAGGAGAVALEGLTIQNGAVADEGGAIRCADSALAITDSVVATSRALHGGGLFGVGCTVAISGTTFRGNRADDRGGGLRLVGGQGEIVGSAFVDNRGEEGAGLAIEGAVALRDSEIRDNAALVRGGGLYLASDSVIDHNQLLDNSSGWTGGGVYVFEHAPVLSSNTIHGNTAENDGGGVYVHMGTASLLDNTVTENVSNDDGGGLRIFTARATVERNVVERNVAADAGGGIRVSHEPTLFVDNVVRDNQATMGAGFDLDNDSSVLRGGVIAGNVAGSSGGGIAATLFPWFGGTIEGVRIEGNRAHRGGGIFLADNFQALAIRGVTLADNRATHGAAVHARSTRFTITNSAIAGNQASGTGGGLMFGAPGAWDRPCPCPPTTTDGEVRFSVFHGNRADEGAQVWVDTPGLILTSSILTAAAGGAAVFVAEPPLALPGMPAPPSPEPAWRYNDTYPATFVGMADPSGTAGNLSTDPMFIAPAAGDFRLRAGSPCIDAGDPAMTDPDASRADMGMYAGPGAP